PPGRPPLRGPAGERLKSFGSASPPGTYGVLRKEPVVTPAFIGPAGLTLDFTSGSGYGAPVRSCGSFPNEIPCGPPGILPSSVALTYAAPGTVLPAAVTRGFAAAAGVRPGPAVPVRALGMTVHLPVGALL